MKLDTAAVATDRSLPKKKDYPVSNLETPTMKDLFLDRSTWHEFKSAFAKI
jgi:hypothetical protein